MYYIGDCVTYVIHIDDPKLKPEIDTLARARDLLNDNKPLSSVDLNLEHLADLHLLIAQPVVYILHATTYKRLKYIL